MSGGVENITVENCTFIQTTSGGVRLKSAIGRGGYIRNVTYNNIIINNPDKGGLILMTDDYSNTNP